MCVANILRERKLMTGAIYISAQKDVFAREKKEMNEEVYSSNFLSKKVKNTPLRYISRLYSLYSYLSGVNSKCRVSVKVLGRVQVWHVRELGGGGRLVVVHHNDLGRKRMQTIILGDSNYFYLKSQLTTFCPSFKSGAGMKRVCWGPTSLYLG